MLAQSEIGKLDLDRTFEERTTINHQVVTEINKASEAWGVKVLRYEIKNIRPPKDITEAEAIRSVAQATADGIRQVAQAIQVPGGHEAVQLRVAEQYVREFGNLAKVGNTLIVPSNLSDVASMITMAMNVVKRKGDDGAVIASR